MQLSTMLHNMRKELAVSRPVMANLLSVSPCTLKNWELGYRGVPADLLLRIAQHEDARIKAYILPMLQAKITNTDMYCR